jgi:hypothetical protein
MSECWQCGEDLGPSLLPDGEVEPDQVAMCVGCGALVIFDDHLDLGPLDAELLSHLSDEDDFRQWFVRATWMRQYALIGALPGPGDMGQITQQEETSDPS